MKDIHQVYKFLKPALEDLTPVQRNELFKMMVRDFGPIPGQSETKAKNKKKRDHVPSIAQYKKMLLSTGLFKSGPGKA